MWAVIEMRVGGEEIRSSGERKGRAAGGRRDVARAAGRDGEGAADAHGALAQVSRGPHRQAARRLRGTLLPLLVIRMYLTKKKKKKQRILQWTDCFTRYSR